MKKARKKKMGLSARIGLLFVVLIVGGVITSCSDDKKIHQKKDHLDEVAAYQPLIQKELSKYHLEKYTPTLLALMQQESKGRGGDPMQASESKGLPPNTIHDPKESIRQGVKHFHNILRYGKRKKVDFPTIIQAYNMGSGYINYVAKHGGKHSEKLAKEFSLIQVHKKPKVYNCGGDKQNFRYPYCYGDFTYSTKVVKTIDSLKATASVNRNKVN